MQVYDAMSEKEVGKGRAGGDKGETEAEAAQRLDGGAEASSAKECGGAAPAEDQCSSENDGVAMEEAKEKPSEVGEGEESKVGVMGTEATDGGNMEEEVENTEEAGGKLAGWVHIYTGKALTGMWGVCVLAALVVSALDWLNAV